MPIVSKNTNALKAHVIMAGTFPSLACGTTVIARRRPMGPCSCRNRGFCRLTTAG